VKSLQRVPIPTTRSASLATRFAARSSRADRAERGGMVEGEGSLAGLRLGHRYAGLIREAPQRVGGAGVDDAAPGHHERPLRGPDRRPRARQSCRIGRPPLDVPHALRQELVGIVVRLRLHVLRKGQRDRAGLRRAGQHAHRGERRGDDLFRSRDAVPVTRYRLKGVVHAHVTARWLLELLQHRIGDTRREDVARQEQNRKPVHGRERGTGEQVGRARADRRGAGEGLERSLVAGISD